MVSQKGAKIAGLFAVFEVEAVGAGYPSQGQESEIILSLIGNCCEARTVIDQ
jgi:hypothetical protein